MGNKFNNVIAWTLIVLAVVCVGVFLVYPLIIGGPYGELKFYARVILLLAIVHTFAGLRLYNAIVNNTRFSIKLREAVIRLQQSFPALQRVMHQLNIEIGGMRDSLRENKKSLERNSDETHEVTELLKKVKTNAKTKA